MKILLYECNILFLPVRVHEYSDGYSAVLYIFSHCLRLSRSSWSPRCIGYIYAYTDLVCLRVFSIMLLGGVPWSFAASLIAGSQRPCVLLHSLKIPLQTSTYECNRYILKLDLLILLRM